MNPITFIYNELLFRPLFNVLVGITNIDPTHNVGIAIIMVTLLVRLILLPSSLHQARQLHKNQTKMSSVQKQIAKAKEVYKNNSAKQAEETMRIYREAGINPASGCLPLLIQLPILLALYKVFFTGLSTDTFHLLYSFVPAPQVLQQTFLGISLTQPSVLLGAIAGFGQFVLMKFFSGIVTPQPGASDQSQQMMMAMQKNMMYIFPVMTVFIAFQLPAALALYWVASTLFAIVQQYLIRRILHITPGTPTL